MTDQTQVEDRKPKRRADRDRMAVPRWKYRSDDERREAVLTQSREKNRRLREARHARGLKKNRVEVEDRPPVEVIAERDSRPHPSTLSQIYFGDPLPGRSALDQRGGQA